MLENKLAKEILKEQSTLIGGTTGSGKTVLVRDIIYQILGEDGFMALIDPKRIELHRYKDLNNTLWYGDTIEDIEIVIKNSENTMDYRFRLMRENGYTTDDFVPLYVIIDELVDISPKLEINANIRDIKKNIQKSMIRIASLGRASNTHIIACTQRPTGDILSPVIKAQFTARVGLRTATPQESRNIIDVKGCESLPLYGKGYFRSPRYTTLQLMDIPKIDLTEDEMHIMERESKPQVHKDKKKFNPSSIPDIFSKFNGLFSSFWRILIIIFIFFLIILL